MLVLLLLALLCAAAVAQPSHVRISGTVIDSLNHRFVAGVDVLALVDRVVPKARTVTDQSGRYTLKVDPGIYDLRFVFAQANPLIGTQQRLTLPAVVVRRDTTISVAVPTYYELALRLTDQEGIPVTQVEINSTTFSGGSRPDVDGVVRLMLPQGEHRFWVNPFPGIELPRRRMLVDMTADTLLAIVLDASTLDVALRGAVVDEAGVPVGGSALVVFSTAGDVARLITNDDGNFFYAAIDSATYQVRVQPPVSTLLYPRALVVQLTGIVDTMITLRGPSDSPLYQDATRRLPVDGTIGLSMDAHVVDLDQDGALDIIVASEFAPNFVLYNDSGSFTRVVLSSQRHDSEDVGVADFDGDGWPDIVVVSEDDRVNELYFGQQGRTQMARHNRLPVEGTSNAVQVADVDGDGDADIVIGNGGAGEQNVLLFNTGSGLFVDATAAHLPPMTDTTQDLELGDADGDGDLDLLVGNEDDNRLLLNDGEGVFTDHLGAIPLSADPEVTRAADFGDIDGDGDLDLFFANLVVGTGGLAAGYDRLLRNDEDAFFTDVSARIPRVADRSFDGNFIDVDGDGDMDVVTANALPMAPFQAYLNDGNGRFHSGTDGVFPAGLIGEGFDVEAADFNDDGIMDLYLANRGGRDRLLLGRRRPTVIETEPTKSKALQLRTSYPNPFNASTVIGFRLPAANHTTLTIFDALGRRVARLVDAPLDDGDHQVRWQGRDDDGRTVGSGIYFVEIQWQAKSLGGKLLLLR